MKNGRKRVRLFFRRAAVCLCGAAIVWLLADGTYVILEKSGPRRPAVSSAPLSSFERVPIPASAPSSAAPPPSAPASSAPKAASAPASAPRAASSKPKKTAGTQWFDDAVFIGDSRTEGLRNYDGLGDATYFAVKGLMVDTVYTKAAVKLGGKKMTVMQALKRRKFGKVYIMLGVNELGWASFETFLQDYAKMVDDVKKDQPGARIYLQSILPVSAKKSASETIYTNPKIKRANDAIRRLAQEKQARYLAVDAAVGDASGALPEGASVDGVHLNAEYCGKWCEYLKTHTGN